MPLLAQDDFAAGLGEIWISAREATATGGRARLACIAEYSALETDRLYPLADTTYTAELITRPDVGIGTTQAILEAAVDSNNKFTIYIEDDVVNFEEIAGGESSETNVLYEPVAHRWWRIRLVGDQVHWETSPDGATWTTRREKKAAVDVEAVAEMRLLAGFYGAESGLAPAYAEFDNVSIVGPHFAPIAVTAAPAGAPLARSATVTGSVNPKLLPASYHFEIGETTEYGRRAPASDAEVNAGNDPVSASARVGGLKPATTYHYRLVATSEGGSSEGDDQTFTTSPGILVAGRIVDPIIQRQVFAGRQLADFNEIHEAPGAIAEVPDPAGGEDTVFKLTVHDEDIAPITPTENPRAQALAPDLLEPGGVYELRGGFYLPADFPDNTPEADGHDGFLEVLAIYGLPFLGPGAWGISVQGYPAASIMCQRNGTYGFDIPWEMPLIKEQWIEIRLRIRFAVNGWIRMWINGDPITFFTAGSSYDPNEIEPTEKLEMQTRDASNNEADNHAKIMNYRQHGMYETVTLYHKPLLVDRIAAAAVS